MSTPAFNHDPERARAAPAPASRYRVHALADPSVLSRVVELFVLRDLIPDRVSAERQGADRLSIELDVAGLAEQEAGHVARRIQAFPMVTGVLLSHG